MQFDIVLNKGVGEILFGMNEAEVISILGTPDKVYITDSNCIRYQYFKEMLEFSFEPENNNLLGWIEVYNPDTQLFNKKIIGIQEEDVISFLSNKIDGTYEVEDYGSFISITYERYWLELQFQFGLLHNINFGKM